MYSGYGFRYFEIGDVDVVKHEGLYHLFHLILPNHDYIAHAVSEDGLRWHRVKNALFISDPKGWDDDMLWTMHVSPNPHQPGAWRMFYTGLCMGEHGRIQRVGLAHSTDLYHWEKDTSGAYPLEISSRFYEHSAREGRAWVSFRDPFCYREDGQTYLIAAARVKNGPIIRRGCIALAREVDENQFQFEPPLFHPMHYDDIEVPNLVNLDGRYFLIGSIREDIKVHYWYADTLRGPYLNFHDNVLLPQGNYAARVSRDDGRWLIWNFFYKGLTTRGEHLLAPPKELVVSESGKLRLKSYFRFDDIITNTHAASDLAPLEPLFGNPHASSDTQPVSCWMSCQSGFEAFLLQGEYSDFILSGEIQFEETGKCGLVFRINSEGDGYYLSLDLFKGIIQLRAWSHKDGGRIEEAYEYKQLQAAHYTPTVGPHPFRLLAYEQYLEFSIHGFVRLTLADDHFDSGRIGFYLESARMRINHLKLQEYECTRSESYPATLPNY